MLLMSFSTVVYAQADTDEGTLLPQVVDTSLTVAACKTKLTELFVSSDPKSSITGDWKNEGMNILACGIKTGQIKLWMVPFYIRYMLEFIIQISGLACVAATVYGGFLYLFAGVSEDKDKGKKAMTYGVMGMVITFLAWGIVNIFIMFVTGA